MLKSVQLIEKMDCNKFSDGHRLFEKLASQTEEHHLRMFNRNCEILKRLELMPDTVKQAKKREMNRCTHFLKKWKASSAMYALESYTTALLEIINLAERKTIVLAEKEKSKKITAEGDSMFNIIDKALVHNKQNLNIMRNTFLKKEDGQRIQINDVYVCEKERYLVSERINELLKKSEEGEKEIKKLVQLKKHQSEKVLTK